MKTSAVLPLLVSTLATALAQTPKFGPALSLPVQKAPLAIAAADFNGDGFQDIAIGNSYSATISIFLGMGNGKFSAAAPLTLPSNCSAAYLTARNFTGAASPDLLAICALGDVLVLPNTGSGTFGAVISTSTPNPAWVGNLLLGSIHPAIADFNGDGHLDIALPTFGLLNLAGSWSLLLGKGDGSFQTPAPLPFVGLIPTSLAAGDFNGDGKPDLVAGYFSGSSFLEFAVGNGDGTFRATSSIILPVSAGSLILVADVNGDGNLDLVFAGSSLLTNFQELSNYGFLGASAVAVFLGNGKGGFTMSFNALEGTYMSGAALANVLGTGSLDLIETTIQGNFFSGAIPTGAIEVRPGNGDGTFGDPIILPFLDSTVPTDIAVADFNGDGRPDIAVASLPAKGISLGGFELSSDLGSFVTSILGELPSGDGDVLLNTTPSQAFTDTNAASFATGPMASGSIVTAFGSNLAGSTAVATALPLPTKLGGDTITVTDSTGAMLSAPLFYVSPTQINYFIPAAAASGLATITVQSGTSAVTIKQQIASVAPGIFADNLFAAGFSLAIVNGVQQLTPLVQNGALVPVNVAGGQTYLVLYGTGIRNHAKPVVATAGTAQITAAYAGAQGVYLGEDQINIQLPASLQGAGTIEVSLLVDGQTSNAVQVLIQ